MVPYKQLARDAGNEPMHDFSLPFKAIVTRNRDLATASSVITLNDNTTVVEISAGGGTAFIRWVPTTETAAVAPAGSVISDGTSANFDNAIGKDTVRRFVIPIEAMVRQASIVGLNKQYGLYNRVAIIGNASVASTEY